MLPTRKPWLVMQEANARLKSAKDLRADLWKSPTPYKILLMGSLLWTIWDQKQLYTIVLVRLGVWAASLDSLFTTSATVIALVAVAFKREFWGLAVGAVFAAIYCAIFWPLENVADSYGQLADWTLVHFWLSTLYLLIISAITQLVIYIRNRAHSKKQQQATPPVNTEGLSQEDL